MYVVKKLYGVFLLLMKFLFGIDMAKKIDTRLRFQKKLNLKNPTTLSDKVTYLELHQQNEIKAMCTDKFEVRKYVREKGLGESLVPILGGPWEDIGEIDIAGLPPVFILKATHGCKMNYVVRKDNLDIKQLEKRVRQWQNTTYGVYSLEPHYAKIPHRIYAEKFLEHIDDLIDYKFHCTNGIPQFVLVCSKRNINDKGRMQVTLDLYDMEWNPIREVIAAGSELPGKGDIPRPALFSEMGEMARILSKDFEFVRVDLYEYESKVYFGELTFSPACCVFPYFTDRFDARMGRKLDITGVKK